MLLPQVGEMKAVLSIQTMHRALLFTEYSTPTLQAPALTTLPKHSQRLPVS